MIPTLYDGGIWLIDVLAQICSCLQPQGHSFDVSLEAGGVRLGSSCACQRPTDLLFVCTTHAGAEKCNKAEVINLGRSPPPHSVIHLLSVDGSRGGFCSDEESRVAQCNKQEAGCRTSVSVFSDPLRSVAADVAQICTRRQEAART